MAKRQFPFHKKFDSNFKSHARKTPDWKIDKTGLVGELMDSPTVSYEKT